jgi:hypothetical protein
MKVRAIATAAERSNAVGTVELECTPHGLSMVYLGLGAFSQGYATATLTSGTGVMVPWPGVLEARLEGDRLYLAVDPQLTPHSRLTLAGFSSGGATEQRELRRQRLVWRIFAGGAAVVGALLAALTATRVSPEVGAATAVVVGFVTALGLLGVGWLAELGLGRGEDERVARRAFLGELTSYLPNFSVGPKPPEPTLRLPPWSELMGLLPRTTLAVVITLTSGLLAVLLVARWIASSEERARERSRAERQVDRAPEELAAVRVPPPAVPAPTASEAPPPSSSPSVSAARGPVAEARGECRCDRSQSLLWADPIPTLSTLVFDRRDTQRGRHRRIELELAAVNNGAEDLKEIALVLDFFEPASESSSERNLVAHRAVYYEGPLGPGQAIKWSVEARGTEFEIHNPIAGTLGARGEGAAEPNALATLLKAIHRPVRLHGAMLLAYVGDARAHEAAVALGEAQREDEASYLGRLLAGTAELRVCDLGWLGGGHRRVGACVFNAGGEARGELGLGLRALSAKLDPTAPLAPPPTVLAEKRVRLGATLAPSRGLRVQAEFPDVDPAGSVLEARADRFDLLDGT